jgi:hypothetical protein
MTATTSQFDAQASCAGGGGCWNPSDDNAAVSGNQIVEVVNSSVAVYSRSGGLLKQTSASSFFNYTTAGLVDPNVEWDRINNRWIIEYDGLPESGTNIQYILVAVSQGSDATAGWYTYQIRVDSAYGGNFVDYPHIGQTNTGIMITANAGNAGGVAFALNKSTLYSGGAWSTVFYSGLAWNVMATNVMDSNKTAYMLAPQVGTSTVDVVKFYDPGQSDQSVSSTSATVSMTMTAPPNAPQPGTSNQVTTGAGQFCNRNTQLGNKVVNANTVASSGYAVGFYMEYDILSNSFPHSNIFFQQGTTYTWMPAVAADDAGNLVVVYTTGNGSTSPEVAVSSGKIGQSNNFASGNIVKQSSASTTTNRWGDYPSAQLDPSQEGRFLVCGTYATDASDWGTEIAFVTATSGVAGTYSDIQSVQSNLAIDGGANTQQTYVQVWGSNETSDQQWVIASSGSGYSITSVQSGLVFDGGPNTQGTHPWLWVSNGSPDQQWTITQSGAGYAIKSVQSGLALDGGPNTQGTQIQLYTSNNSVDQQWRLIP